MCLGIPGKVVRWLDHDPIFATAEVEFAGIQRVCQMVCVPEAQEGEYVIVHAGVAISRINSAAAEQALREIASLGDDEGWQGESAT